MRLRVGSASTHTSDSRRRRGRSVGRGAVAALLLVGILLVTVFAAQTASAAAPKMAKLTVSGVRELPAGLGVLRGETGASGNLLPAVPAPVPGVTGARAAAVTIFYDGSEGSSSPWSVVGDPTWAITTYRAAVGAHSSYCAGSAFPAPGPYANGMSAWRIAGPFDLSGVTAATFAFKLWLNSQLNYDGIFWGVSVNGQNYYGPGTLTGNSQGWIDRSLDLTAVPTLGNVCGRSQVWIAFNFTSDSSGNAEGAYVDEVSITGSGSGGADDDIPGVAIPSSPFTGSLSRATDYDDVFQIALTAGQTLTAGLTGPSGSDFRLYLYAPGTASVKDPSTPFVAGATKGSYPRSFSYTPTQSGTYYLDAYSYSGDGGYTVTYSAGGGEVGLVLSADPLTVPYRGAVDLSVTLMDASSGSLLPGREIEWWYAQDDNIQRDWIIGGTDSSPTGEYLLRLSPISKRTYFIMRFPGDGQYEEGWSNFVKVMARAKLTPPAVPSRVRAGARITSWGSLKPQHTASQNKSSHTKLYVEHYFGGRWRLQFKSLYAMSYRNTPTDTKYSVTLRYKPGKWRIRAVHQDSDHAKTSSSWRSFKAN